MWLSRGESERKVRVTRNHSWVPISEGKKNRLKITKNIFLQTQHHRAHFKNTSFLHLELREANRECDGWLVMASKDALRFLTQLEFTVYFVYVIEKCIFSEQFFSWSADVDHCDLQVYKKYPTSFENVQIELLSKMRGSSRTKQKL